MAFFSKIQSYIFPKEVDFFGHLIAQSKVVSEVVDTFCRIYVDQSADEKMLNEKFQKSQTLRQQNLIELNEVLITPIDKEAISRAYLQMDWVVLSIKHLYVEIQIYKISALTEYKNIFDLLHQQITAVVECFSLLKEKKYQQVLDSTKAIIAKDDEVISAYSAHLSRLFDTEFNKHILKYKEILSQLKEVSKRIHICANTIEDFVFKMN